MGHHLTPPPNLVTLVVSLRNQVMKPIVINSRGPYRYVQCGILEINGMPDYRLQEKDEYTGKYHDIYLFDNSHQFLLAMEDYYYTLWLAGAPHARHDSVSAPNYGATV